MKNSRLLTDVEKARAQTKAIFAFIVNLKQYGMKNFEQTKICGEETVEITTCYMSTAPPNSLPIKYN